MKYSASVDGRDFVIDLDHPGEITVDGEREEVNLRPIDGGLYSLLLGTGSFEVYVERREGTYYIIIEGDRYAVEVDDARIKQLRAMSRQEHEVHGTLSVLAPMPGLVVRVLVAAGEEVLEGQGVAILEAMKMENEIRSPRTGIVQTVLVHPGKTVNQGDALLVVGDAE